MPAPGLHVSRSHRHGNCVCGPQFMWMLMGTSVCLWHPGASKNRCPMPSSWMFMFTCSMRTRPLPSALPSVAPEGNARERARAVMHIPDDGACLRHSCRVLKQVARPTAFAPPSGLLVRSCSVTCRCNAPYACTVEGKNLSSKFQTCSIPKRDGKHWAHTKFGVRPEQHVVRRLERKADLQN